MSEVKQVIVMRKDLKMRRGKEIAQGAHASMKWMADRIEHAASEGECAGYTNEEWEWLGGAFTKVCLQVQSEDDLVQLYLAAKLEGLTVYMIVDAGKTEFNGVPTKTCLAIGPNRSDRIDKITGHLKLY